MTRFLVWLGVWLGASLLPAGATDFTRPGPYAIGQQAFTIEDVTGKHPMPTLVWYPAEGTGRQSGSEPLHATPNAVPAMTGPLPLIVLIPGLDTSGMPYLMVGKFLASYGFVVIAAYYDTGLYDGADDGVDVRDSLPLRLLHNRPANVGRVIDFAETISAPDGKLAGLIDTSRVGVWGHSTGGTTALQVGGARIDLGDLDAWCAANTSQKNGESCQYVGHEAGIARSFGASDPFAAALPALSDSRVAALVLAAPGGELHVFGDTGIGAMTLPTLIMVSSVDEMVPPGVNALWAFDAIGSQDKALAVFATGGHTFFTASGTDFDAAIALATAFFLDILSTDADAKEALMPGAVSFPGMTYKTTFR